jgi:hypothetical protein
VGSPNSPLRADTGRCMTSGTIELRSYRPGDEGSILSSFNTAFSAVDPTFEPRSPDTWSWRFQKNPSGSRIELALDDEGNVLAHYAGLGQRIQLDGEILLACHVVDSFVAPRARRGCARPTLFTAVAERFAVEFCGIGMAQDELAWGLPVRSAWRIGRAQLGYRTVRNVLKLVAPAAACTEVPEIALDEPRSFPSEVDELFARVSSEHGAIAVRDRAQLDWRFAARPDAKYGIAIARSAGVLRGFAVARAGEFDGERAMLVCDWLVPSADDACERALRAWIHDRALAAGCDKVCAHFAETSPQFQSFQRAGWRVRPTSYPLVARSFAKRADLDRLRACWYTTLGDTDLV